MLVRIDHEEITDRDAPVVTRDQLVQGFLQLGVAPGQTLLVHASLRSFGWVDDGAATVTDALREALGPDGNIVVPASTETNSLTSRKHRERIARMTAKQAKRYRDNAGVRPRHNQEWSGGDRGEGTDEHRRGPQRPPTKLVRCHRT